MMKYNFKILLFLGLAGVLLNSCKKADFSSVDPNLVGNWRTYYTGSSSGSTIVFSDNRGYMEFKDYGDGSSREDDIICVGSAKFRNGIIKLKNNKFKIEEYPISFDTIIQVDAQLTQTHWRMKIKRAGSYGIGGNWNETQTYYRE